MHTAVFRSPWRSLSWLAAFALFCTAAAVHAQEQDPPSRVGTVSFRQGSVVYAPAGDEEWIALPQNRPLTAGDRIWTDNGARAEVQLGSATLHVDGQSHLGIGTLDERAAQFILMQGSVLAHVRDLSQGENFEIDTPNLAFRASQPGDYRVDIDSDGRETRVVVLRGMASVYGEGGAAINLGAGQQASFGGRYLAQVRGMPYQDDGFAQWAADRNRVEDQSIASRYLPRGVVGSEQLDGYGTWSQDPSYGAVWYPTVTVANWAPYRYGHWAWIGPWGWTWVDDEPWGFAPFHYGRWAFIGSRWAWVPGRMVARPVYSPALVEFLGDGGDGFSIGAGPAVGWYPLAPGEAWYPAYRTSTRYVNFANFNINLNGGRRSENHVFRQRPWAVTAVREDDFRAGRPIWRHWQPVQPGAISQAHTGVVPPRPDRRVQVQPAAPRLQGTPPATSSMAPGEWPSRYWSGRAQPDAQQRPPGLLQQPRPAQAQVQTVQPQQPGRMQWEQRDRLLREQEQAQRDQERLQRDAERQVRQQQAAAARHAQEQNLARQQQEAVQAQREELLRTQRQQQQQIEALREQVQQQQRQLQQVRPAERERAEARGWRGRERDHDGGDDDQGRGRRNRD